MGILVLFEKFQILMLRAKIDEIFVEYKENQGYRDKTIQARNQLKIFIFIHH